MEQNPSTTAPVFPVYFANQDESRAIMFESDSIATIVRVDRNEGGEFMSMQRKYVLPAFYLTCKINMLEVTQEQFCGLMHRAMDAQTHILKTYEKICNGEAL